MRTVMPWPAAAASGRCRSSGSSRSSELAATNRSAASAVASLVIEAIGKSVSAARGRPAPSVPTTTCSGSPSPRATAMTTPGTAPAWTSRSRTGRTLDCKDIEVVSIAGWFLDYMGRPIGSELAIGGDRSAEQTQAVDAEDGAAEQQEAAVEALGEESNVAMERQRQDHVRAD